jgi:hypothetical protein
MTCLIAWIGVDPHGPSSCYLLSDSRFSWKTASVWDGGRKVFCSRKSPDIWGYYGDVVFPTVVINQIIDAIDQGHISDTADRQNAFERIFKDQLASYPLNEIGTFGVVHCHRNGKGTRSEFQIRHLHWTHAEGWQSETLPLPKTSDLVEVFGSGRSQFKHWLNKFERSDVGGTSRSLFQAFCKMLEDGVDPQVGGAPQLVSLIRIENGKQHGIAWNSHVWLAGLKLDEVNPAVEVYNSLFERCNPVTLQRLGDAQAQPIPRLD